MYEKILLENHKNHNIISKSVTNNSDRLWRLREEIELNFNRPFTVDGVKVNE